MSYRRFCRRVIRNRLLAFFRKGHGEPIVRHILSGPLDADKQDYLLRDTYFCGVKYGTFDLAQFHQVLESVADPTGGKVLMINPEGIHTLEQFVLAKYYMTTQVIKHRIRLITDQMLLRAICLGIERDQIDELRDIYSFDGSYSFITRYSQWGDARLLQRFADIHLKANMGTYYSLVSTTEHYLSSCFELQLGLLNNNMYITYKTRYVCRGCVATSRSVVYQLPPQREHGCSFSGR